MNRKITLFNDVKTKILAKTGIAFYDRGKNFRDTVMRQTIFFGNIDVSLNPKFSASCIILTGTLLQGLICHGEEEDYIISEENRTHIYIISKKKLLKRHSRNYLHIYPLNFFKKLENISQLYIKFFKHCPFEVTESIKYIFEVHQKANSLFRKKYFQSEFIVSYIAYINSRVKSNFEKKYRLLYLIKFLYKCFLLFKTLSANELCLFWKNNSHYFIVYNAEIYKDFFEEDFIILNSFE